MTRIFYLLLFLFLSNSIYAKYDSLVLTSPVTFSTPGKDPIKTYKKAKQKNALSKLTLQQRMQILTAAWKDSTLTERMSVVQRDDMVKNVIVTTPENKIQELFHLLGTDLQGFQERFDFLHFAQMSFILNYITPSFNKRVIDSKIFKIPYELFKQQLQVNIDQQGDNLFQSHYTDFCGKVAVVRLWIKCNPDDYAKFMTDLYYTGKTTWNGIEFETPESVISAINGNDISEDPNQKIKFKNEETTEKMPEMMDMALYLTLASTFHTFPFNAIDYKAEKHLENTAWAGAAINPQVIFLRSMGFQVQKVGDNFRGISTQQFDLIKAAGAPESNKRVILLVNSSMLDTLSGAQMEYSGPRPIEHKQFGTHWITINYINETTNEISFWEYGKHRSFFGIRQLKTVIAGGIIIEGYDPK